MWFKNKTAEIISFFEILSKKRTAVEVNGEYSRNLVLNSLNTSLKVLPV